jgi:hypothetical protein
VAVVAAGFAWGLLAAAIAFVAIAVAVVITRSTRRRVSTSAVTA